MAYEILSFELSGEKDARFAEIVFNSPPVNAISPSLLSEFSNAIDQAEQESCRAILLTGEGKAFIAGADISVMKSFSPEQANEFIVRGQTVINQLEQSTLITLAAINGFTLGGGLELALACDIRILSDKATIGLPEVSLGVIPAFGGTQRLSRMVGEGNAKYFILTGNHITPDQALSTGIVQEVVPHEQLLVESKKRIQKILTNGPLAVSAAKKLVHSSLIHPLKKAYRTKKNTFVSYLNLVKQMRAYLLLLKKENQTFRTYQSR